MTAAENLLTTNMSMPDHAGNDEQDFSKHHIFKIIVIGNSNVGKTCLTVRFCRGRFMGNVETTIGFDCLEKTVAFGDHSVKVSVVHILFIIYLMRPALTLTGCWI